MGEGSIGAVFFGFHFWFCLYGVTDFRAVPGGFTVIVPSKLLGTK